MGLCACVRRRRLAVQNTPITYGNSCVASHPHHVLCGALAPAFSPILEEKMSSHIDELPVLTSKTERAQSWKCSKARGPPLKQHPPANSHHRINCRFGFNCGSALSITKQNSSKIVSLAAVNTTIAPGKCLCVTLNAVVVVLLRSLRSYRREWERVARVASSYFVGCVDRKQPSGSPNPHDSRRTTISFIVSSAAGPFAEHVEYATLHVRTWFEVS